MPIAMNGSLELENRDIEIALNLSRNRGASVLPTSYSSIFRTTSSWVKDSASSIRVPAIEVPGLKARRLRGSVAAAEVKGLEGCPPDWKMFYVRCLISLAIRTEDRLSPRETAELRLIMSNLRLEPRERILLCKLFTQPAEDIEVGEFNGLSDAQQGWVQTFKFCLLKDLLRIHALESQNDPSEHDFVQAALLALDFDAQHMEAAKAVIKTEIDLLEGREPAPVIEQTAKTSLSLVTGAGIPVAAIFYSGSVTGLSAAGITSGLASIGGMGLALGVSPMVSGLAAVGAVGVGSALGAQALSNAVWGKKQREKVRHNMRMQAVEALQVSLSELAADVNLLTSELNNVAADQEILINRLQAIALKDTLLSSQGSLEERLYND